MLFLWAQDVFECGIGGEKNTMCSRMQRMLHSPGITWNLYVSKIVAKIANHANQQGQGLVLAEGSQGTFECKSWRCHRSVLVRY